MDPQELEDSITGRHSRPKLEDAVQLAKLLGITEVSKLFELLETLSRKWQVKHQLD